MHGLKEIHFPVALAALPKAPGTPVVTERTATSITLTWDSGNPEPVSYYIIQHKSKYSDDLYKEIDGVATTRYSVGGLSPYSDYEFRVVAVNNIGRGPPSEIIEAKTAEQAPSTAPRQVRGHMMSSTTAVIHWDEPEEANGQIMGYRVYYTMDSGQHVNLWEKQIVRGSNFVTIQGLIPNRTYYIKVLAYTSVGDGPLSPDLQIITKTGGRDLPPAPPGPLQVPPTGEPVKPSLCPLQFPPSRPTSREKPSLKPASCCRGSLRLRPARRTRSPDTSWSTGRATTKRR